MFVCFLPISQFIDTLFVLWYKYTHRMVAGYCVYALWTVRYTCEGIGYRYFSTNWWNCLRNTILFWWNFGSSEITWKCFVYTFFQSLKIEFFHSIELCTFRLESWVNSLFFIYIWYENAYVYMTKNTKKAQIRCKNLC